MITAQTPRRLIAGLLLLLLAAALAAGCSASPQAGSDHAYPMASLEGMPAEVHDAPLAVQQAYQFAAANPDVLTQIPCYCGCGAMGHASNYACYISAAAPDGDLTYDSHALGCSICVDITQDTMRLLDEGKSVPEIKAYVDQIYAPYGPSNMP
jgi:hypothetical protein